MNIDPAEALAGWIAKLQEFELWAQENELELGDHLLEIIWALEGFEEGLIACLNGKMRSLPRCGRQCQELFSSYLLGPLETRR